MGVASIAKSGQKRARHETIIGPAIDKDVAHEAVGLKPATLVPKEIPVIKKKNPVLQVYAFQAIVAGGNYHFLTLTFVFLDVF